MYTALARAFGGGLPGDAGYANVAVGERSDLGARVVEAVLRERFRRADQLVDLVHEDGDEHMRDELATVMEEIAIGLERLRKSRLATDPSYLAAASLSPADREKIRQYFDRVYEGARAAVAKERTEAGGSTTA